MNFDEKAINWDAKLEHTERAQILAAEIRQIIQPNPQMTAFEFGCGTGLLSFSLKNDFKKITLGDSSKGMIDVLSKKIQTENIHNFQPLLIDLTKEENPDLGGFDVIYTSMTLHHITDINNLMKLFNKLLPTNGYLCIADLDREDGSFHSHSDNFNGYFGFQRSDIENYYLTNGFEVIYYNIALMMNKIVDSGETKQFPVFLIVGKKKEN
ncbi:MAG: class I SAM-dependent methyltransferase [Candidatus Kapabacteria bacterium]|nr:class I SAM-dependent methyltransferase [Candidatus Kapabacteria bacterium]